MRLSLTAKLVALTIGLSLIPVGLVSYLALGGQQEIKNYADILGEGSLEQQKWIAEGLNDLAAAHESFMIYVLAFGTTEGNRNQIEMGEYQDNFTYFITQYSAYYSLSKIDGMSEILIDRGKQSLIEDENALITDIRNKFDDYEEKTTEVQGFLNDGNFTEAYSAAGDASIILEMINTDMDELITIDVQAADAVGSVMEDTIARSTLYTSIGAAGVAGAVGVDVHLGP